MAQALSDAEKDGFGPASLAALLQVIADERSSQREASDRIELVWSGPETVAATTRDTSVVVNDLFRRARRSVVLSGYAIHQGKQVFRHLAANADMQPDLRVRMFCNVQRNPGDPRTDNELLRGFAERFRNEQWPGQRLPEVYYDPRALSLASGPRACLHAKCVIVDEELAFVTSANFTEAAQERNIEAGVLVQSTLLARSLASQFERLVDVGALRRIAGLG
ncbi:MAG: phospholipase [Proteobacteria bacterium]|nr:MAG: phospholipase [Pseudomonadota bacterium]